MHLEISTSRRKFFKSSLFLGAAAGLASFSPRLNGVEPFRRKGKPHFHLGLAAYSFREFFQDVSHERTTASTKRISLFDFIDFCAEQGIQGAELTSYYFPRNFDEAFLIKLRRHAFLQGVEISGTAVGNTFTLPEGPKRRQEIELVKNWINHSHTLGASHLRVFAGSAGKLTPAEAKKQCLAALEECHDLAARKGVFLGLENHGGIVAEAADLLELVKTIQSPWVGINLDTGNFHTEDPYADLERCAPYAVNVQVKARLRPRSGKVEKMDMARVMKILRQSNYQGYVVLEYEEPEDPWTAIPRLVRELKPLLEA